ncbi:hypothetical protein [Microlunatus soli]|uniref:Uncharacterized protein n=1 Tax=Microlunatus soli TaxID=630515 RepID=A0A1H1ZP36_9ACTN|nr:hypothetical protein [Microlunatus soli]SDT35379.1 hypothetical protein SAMN04489812_5349 [Microlunatus soli]
MSAATIEAVSSAHGDKDRATRTAAPIRVRRPRRSRGSGRGAAPVGRSTTGVAAPRLVPGRSVPVDGRQATATACRDERVAAAGVRSVRQAATASWRLTNRGIAVVMITGAMLMAAAVTVITATALTVTSPDYTPAGHSAVAGR